MAETTFHLRSSPRAPSLAREHISRMRPVLEPRYDDVLLLLNEMVTNSVRHTDTPEITVTVSTDDSSIRVEVEDSGGGFAENSGAPKGFGLAIVDHLADVWGHRKGSGFLVWAELSKVASE